MAPARFVAALSRARGLLAAAGLLLVPSAGHATEPWPVPDQAAVARYQARVPKSILDLQQFRRTETITIEGAAGSLGSAELIELNPHVNAWFLLTLGWGGATTTHHIENPRPRSQRIRLSVTWPGGLLLDEAGETYACNLWSDAPSALEHARASKLPYAPLCDDRLYLRNPTAGRRSDLERVTDFLRDHVWGGEVIVGFVREAIYRDAFMETARPEVAIEPAGGGTSGAPQSARIDAAFVDRAVRPAHLGIARETPDERMLLGRWYAADGLPGVFLSVIEPGAVDRALLETDTDRAEGLDAVEASALDYMVAFDLQAYEVGFVLGTDHPRLGWSERPPSEIRDEALPGPDGVATATPLVATGMVAPALVGRTIATFTGGFKRIHSGFRYGDLAWRNQGSHYGFIEAGVVFSKPQPGLATLYRLDDGSLHMTTWSAADEMRLGRIVFLRQNGVPLVEPNPATGAPRPGALVRHWGAGNWSGSAEGKLRTLRAGACLLEKAGRRFLAYGYFSSATPSAMARVFQAYGCHYAMHLDMNALEHTYLALYVHQDDEVGVQHLINGMEVLDQSVDGQMVPRFIGFPDSRDFFFVDRRDRE
jgi:hypothetical protein